MPGLARIEQQAVVPGWTALLGDAVSDLRWGAAGELFAGSASGEVRRYHADGECLASWQAHDGSVIRVRPNPAGETIATCGEDGRVRLWDENGGAMQSLAEEPGWIEHLEWVVDGSVLAAAAEKTIYLWRGAKSLGVWYDARRRVLAMAWAPDGKRLATASNKGVFLWRLGGQEPVELLAFPGAAVSVAWSSNGQALAVGTQDGFMQVWTQDKTGRSRQLTMRGYPGKVSCLQWHPIGQTIATAGGRDVVVWRIASRKGKQTAVPLRQHEGTVTCLAYAPSGAWLASGDRHGRVCLWSDSGRMERAWEQASEITVMRWRPDGNGLAVGGTDGRLQVYGIGPSEVQ